MTRRGRKKTAPEAVEQVDYSETTDINVLNWRGQFLRGQLAYTVQEGAKPPPVIVHATVLIDVSSSMSIKAFDGYTRLNNALRYVRHIATDLLAPSDRLTVALFDVGYYQMWHNAPVASVLDSFQRVESEAAWRMIQANGTAVWDNVWKALQSMQKTQCGPQDKDGNTVLRYMVTITGGEDNWSTNTLAAVVEAIREPGMSNFNYLALCVGAQDVASMINDAFKGVRHMHVRVIRPDGSPNFLADVFRTAKKRMLKPKQALAETLTLKIVNNAKGAKPSMPELLGQFGAMHLGGGRRTRGQLG